MDARLLVIADRHFNGRVDRQVQRQVLDDTGSQLNERLVARGPTLDDVEMDPSLVGADGAE